MNRFLNNWTLMRVIRLGIGGYGLVDGLQRSEILMIVLGTFFIVQAIFNWGCSSCASGNCEIKTENTDENEKLDTQK